MTMSKGLSTYLGVKVSKLKVMCGMSLDSAAREERAIQAVTADPIPASKFVSVYKHRVKNKHLVTEFKALVRNQEDHPSQAALKNVLLNNKQDVVPCDHSRVIVWEGYDVTGSDYYNASYIDGYNGPKEYIACQGPSSKTFALFWHMIWQEGVTCVVMATGLFENAVQQCDKYWVDHSKTHAQYGRIHVWHEKSTYLAQLNIRSFRLRKEGSCDSRVLIHYEMVGLHEECPSSGLLLDVRRRVSALSGQSLGPVLVHCRCGGGRSAVYQAVDYCLQKLQAEDRVDVYSTVLHLRRFRKNMVKTVHQYQQVYDAVAMYIQCGLTVYPKHLLPDVYRIHYTRRGESKSHRLEREFQSLQTVVPKLSIGDCASGHRVENRSKSRDIMMLPPERARPYLTTADCGDGGTDFINAVYIDGYHAENTYLVTQWPMKRTIADVWRLFFDFKMTSLVVMNEVVKFSRNYPRFWPKEISQVVSYGPISVRYISCIRRPDLVIRTFAIRKPRRHPHLIAQALVRISEDVMIMNNLVGCELRQDEIIVKMFQVAGSSSSRSSLKRKNLQRQSYQTMQFKVDLRPDEPRRGSYDVDDLHLRVDCRDDDRDRKGSGVGLQSRSLLAVMEHVEDWQKRSGSRQSVCVLSKDGCSRAGLYCTVSNCCDQLKVEKEVDVFSAVRYARINRPQMVHTLEEYRYIYHFMTEYILLTKTRPDIVITKPTLPSILSFSELENSAGTRAAIATSSLHGGVYIRNQPPPQFVAKRSELGKSVSKHKDDREPSSSKSGNHVHAASTPSSGSSFGQEARRDKTKSAPRVDSPPLVDNFVAGISPQEIVPSGESNSNVNSQELVVGRGLGAVLSSPSVKLSFDSFGVDSSTSWSHSHLDQNSASGGFQSHPSLPSSPAASLGQLPYQRPQSAASRLTTANSHVRHPEDRKMMSTNASLRPSTSNYVSSSPTPSPPPPPRDIPVPPCACLTTNPPIDYPGAPHGHVSLSPPMQRPTQPRLQKCFLSPGIYAQGSQLTKASLSSLGTNSSFHSCHSSFSDVFTRSAANSPSPPSHTSNAISNPCLSADDDGGGSGGGCGGGSSGRFLSNGFYPFSDVGSNSGATCNRCGSFTSLSTEHAGVQGLQVNHVTSMVTPLRSSAESTLIHASYASLEDSIGDSLDDDHYSSLAWMEQNNNAHVIKRGLQAERTARKEASIGNSFFTRSRSKVIPWPSPLSFVKKIKDYRLSRRKT